MLSGTDCSRFATRAGREHFHVQEKAYTVAAVAPQSAALQLFASVALEMVLALAQPTTASPLMLWLLTGGSNTMQRAEHAGPLGLARSARAETASPLLCTDAAMAEALQLSPSLSEPEEALRRGLRSVFAD